MQHTKLFITVFSITLLTTTLNAQNYNTALGVRLGYDSGLTLKYFFAPENAAEFILSISPRYFQLTGMYEYQQLVPGSSDLSWVVGIGVHVGGIHHEKDKHKSNLLLGVDLMAGLEYSIARTPYTVGLDWKPSFNFTNSYNDYWLNGFALSLRYTLY
mgnify:CR=1 FL=1